MFSHDLRKKQKKWHDGSVRFHTFNKRVMVYDDVKNFIGDLHYRDQEEFAEGTELRLDRGVLVQVEDRIGQTETDLAPLLDRRHHDDEASAHNPALRPLTQRTYDKSKSLAAVLGPSQGPLGRARLPQRSPFEHRHVNTAAYCTEQPPLKRLRLSSDKENVPQSSRRLETIATPRPASTNDDPGLEHGRRPLAYNPVEVIDLSLEVEDELQDAGQRRRPAPRNYVSPVAEQQARKSDSNTNPVNDTVNRPPKNISTTKILSRPAENPVREKPPRRTSPERTSKARLQFKHRPPRSKLMYKDLLPQNEKPASSIPASRSTANVKPRPRENAPIDPNNAGRAHPHEDEVMDIDDLIAATPPIPTVDLQESLFLSQSVCSIAVHDTLNDESIEMMDPPDIATTSPYPISDHQNSLPDSPAQTPSSQPIEKLPTLTALDQRLLQPPAPRLPPPKVIPERLAESPQPRPFRRVLSENDSTLLPEDHQPRQTAIPSGLQSLKNRQTRQAPTSFQSPTKLNRCQSDLSALAPGPHNQGGGGATSDGGRTGSVTEVDSGPWSHVEAYLLFEWWPRDRPKPLY